MWLHCLRTVWVGRKGSAPCHDTVFAPNELMSTAKTCLDREFFCMCPQKYEEVSGVAEEVEEARVPDEARVTDDVETL